jgi:hypothetical protein
VFSNRSRLLLLPGTLVAAFLMLCIPAPAPPLGAPPARSGAFTWDRDGFWKSLESRFIDAHEVGCATAGRTVDRDFATLEATLADLAARPVGPADPVLDTLETTYFSLAPLLAACPQRLPEYLGYDERIREAVKDQSQGWDMSATPARSRIYRALYGTRLAAEELMLHHPDDLPALVIGRDEPSATPAALVEGVTIHSGDILVSRGGYPTSALIARGNDYPGNFSHIALVHVDPSTHEASTIEAHIESGVVVSPAQQYLDDRKLRIMVLRPRADLPPLLADPLLPHRAAAAMLARATRSHIPYDFKMDYRDPSRLFCSEVASAAYLGQGVTLWTGLSTISRPGLRRWLWDFGVRHFETQEPSDLEYDPQLVVVAEWRDEAMLTHDRIDNATIDAMLDGADRGDALDFKWYQLPLLRLAKGYSWALNRFGRIGPVPEGMSATAALRNRAFSERQRRIAAQVAASAEAFEKKAGYPAPYWTLVELAGRAAAR